MRKIGVLFVCLLLALSFGFVVAEDNESDTTLEDDTVTTQDDNSDEYDKAFACLESKAGSSCSSLDTVQEIALTILASPTNIYDGCVSKLKGKMKNNNFGNIRDTALGILALDHAGENTVALEEWLLSQERNPSEIIWYLQQDSEGETDCRINYDSNTHSFTVGRNKKIDSNAGNCLTKAQSNFWYKVAPSCYDKTFVMECDQDYIASLLYKNQNSQVFHVLENTQFAPEFTSVELEINSKCLGSGSSCDYEGTAWAVVALRSVGRETEKYLPYLIAMAESNTGYLPEAFIYMADSTFNDYATRLIRDQKSSGLWQADSTRYNRYYDSALALLSLGISQEQTERGKEALFFEQASNGCWSNNARDTAMVLWALLNKPGKSSTSITYCEEEGNFFCLSESTCDTVNINRNYYCSSSLKICCEENNLLSCAGQNGMVCPDNLECSGAEVDASDTRSCCLSECIERGDVELECETIGEGNCLNSCDDTYYDEVPEYDDCGATKVCCKRKEVSEAGTPWWIWVLLALILIVTFTIAWIKRELLKAEWFKLKSRFGKGGANPPGAPGGPRPPRPPMGGRPLRPGMPPRRPMQRPMMRRPNVIPRPNIPQ